MGRSTQSSRVPGVLPQSQQKQFTSNPLDTLPLLLPTITCTCIDVKEVSVTKLVAEAPRPLEVKAVLVPNLVAKPPKPLQDQLSSTEAELHCSSALPPLLGNQISIALYDAGSILQRKTRLGYCLLETFRQLLGIYAAPEPVPTVMLLLSPEPTFIRLQRAEMEVRLVQISSALHLMQMLYPTLIVISLCALQRYFCAILLPDACATILDAVLYHYSQSVAIAAPLRTFGCAAFPGLRSWYSKADQPCWPWNIPDREQRKHSSLSSCATDQPCRCTE